jgi:hypothetical protein
MDIEHIASQVKYNCNISDAKYWGFYSPCGLLLRLRDLYKIENEIKPWERVELEKISNWIGRKEELWKEIDALDFQMVVIKGKKYHPFDIKGINAVLMKEGFLYGAGYDSLLKPTFLLAQILSKTKLGKYSIYTLDKEIARDLSAAPAMLQGNTILARYETIKLFLWGKLEEMKSIKHSGILSYAFSEYGVSKSVYNELAPEKLESHLSKIAYEELSTCIYHELGEASQRRLLGRWWKELILKLQHSRAELFIRALKDVLADTCRGGMLAHIITQRKAGSLGFYVALLGGFRKIIFPNIVPAYEKFINTRSWALIEKARIEGYRKTKSYIKTLKEIVDSGKISPEEIEHKLIQKVV